MVTSLMGVFLGSHGQSDPLRIGVAGRTVDTGRIRSLPWVYHGELKKTDCMAFICNYGAVPGKAVHIAAFAEGMIHRHASIFTYTPVHYKEVPAENVQHVRMRYQGDSVRLFVAGDSVSLYPIDPGRKGYLVRVYHSNGMESLYYPVYGLSRGFDPSVPGSYMGLSAGVYFWQLRHLNRSFPIRGFVGSDFRPDRKGVLVENAPRPAVTSGERYRGFMESLTTAMKDNEEKQNYSKDLLDRMKEKD